MKKGQGKSGSGECEDEKYPQRNFATTKRVLERDVQVKWSERRSAAEAWSRQEKHDLD
jgi:hypothetical protein